jgi:hypothetical protein
LRESCCAGLHPSPLPLAGEGQGGGSLRNGSGNRLKDACGIFHHIEIAETKDFETLGFDYSRTRCVRLFGLVGEMLPAVEFDHEHGGVTYEIGDEILDRDLAAEAGAIQSVIAQRSPEDAFCVGGIFSESPSVRTELRGDFPGWAFFVGHRDLRCGDTPTPALPRKRERESDRLLG